jgi:hypothetical protein
MFPKLMISSTVGSMATELGRREHVHCPHLQKWEQVLSPKWPRPHGLRTRGLREPEAADPPRPTQARAERDVLRGILPLHKKGP